MAFQEKAAAARARDGLAQSTRSQVFSAVDAASSRFKSVSRICKDKKRSDDNESGNSPSCIMTVSDSKASIDATGCCNDSSDESIGSMLLAERAVIKGICKIESIDVVQLEAAMADKDKKPKLYKFFCAFRVPSTVLPLNSSRLPLKNILYFIDDDAVACEDSSIGRLVLLHLRLNTRTLLEDVVTTFNVAHCSPNALSNTKGGRVSRLMLVHINLIGNDQMDETDQSAVDPAGPMVNDFSAHAEEDSLSDLSLLYPIDHEPHCDIKAAAGQLQKTPFANGLAGDKRPSLVKLLVGTRTSSTDLFLQYSLNVSGRSRLSSVLTPSPLQLVCATTRKNNRTF